MEIRKAEFKDAEKLAEIFRNDLGEPDCTKELVLKKMQLLDDCRECVFVAAIQFAALFTQKFIMFCILNRCAIFWGLRFAPVAAEWALARSFFWRQKTGQKNTI